jgi:protein TonB
MLIPKILRPEHTPLGATRVARTVAACAGQCASLKPRADLDPLGVALRQNLFAQALLEKASTTQRRRPVDWIISLGIHVAVLGALLAAPLFFTQAIDLRQLTTTILVAPSVPAPPPPPPAAVAVTRAPRRPVNPPFQVAKLIAPAVVPRVIPRSLEDAAAPEVNVEGVAGGVPGGVPGGVLEGVLGGAGSAAVPAEPEVHNIPKPPVRVGGAVKWPRQIYSVPPQYPPLLLRTRVTGKVCVDAIIDEQGNVVQPRAVCGNPLLIAAALEAVRKWKYEPTYLNGVPVSVSLTLDVNFQLH